MIKWMKGGKKNFYWWWFWLRTYLSHFACCLLLCIYGHQRPYHNSQDKCWMSKWSKCRALIFLWGYGEVVTTWGKYDCFIQPTQPTTGCISEYAKPTHGGLVLHMHAFKPIRIFAAEGLFHLLLALIPTPLASFTSLLSLTSHTVTSQAGKTGTPCFPSASARRTHLAPRRVC